MPTYRHADGATLHTSQPHPGCEASPRWTRTDTGEQHPADDQDHGGPPATSANKPEWVAWAVAHRGVDQDAAQAMTIPDLQALADEGEGG